MIWFTLNLGFSCTSDTRLFDSAMLVPYFSAHCISDHRISDQKVRTVMVRVRVRVRVMVRVWVRVRVRVRLGGAVVRNAVGRKVGNPLC